MSRLDPDKMHVRLLPGASERELVVPRRYTLTHSDATGDLFLAIGPNYDREAISGWYTRLMRDEVLAEWQLSEHGPSLHLYCHISGGLTLGPAGLRYRIFQRELPLVLEALRFGDASLFAAEPELDNVPIWVHFRAIRRRYQRTEHWGTPTDYQLHSIASQSGGGGRWR